MGRLKRKQPPLDVQEIRERFAYWGPTFLFGKHWWAGFFKELPTREEQVAYARAFPAAFTHLWGLGHGIFHSDRYCPRPESGMFRRFAALKFFAHHHVDIATFDPPQLERDGNPTFYLDFARARATWWIGAKLPVTQQEIDWLRQHAPDLVAGARRLARDNGQWDKDHEGERDRDEE